MCSVTPFSVPLFLRPSAPSFSPFLPPSLCLFAPSSSLLSLSLSLSLFLSLSPNRLEFFGVDLFAARDHHGVELGLGVTSNGISVFKDKILITTFGWLVLKLSSITDTQRTTIHDPRPCCVH